MNQPAASHTRHQTDWDRLFERLLVPFPWATLAPATVISQLPAGQSAADRAVTLGLAGIAGAWVYLLHTRATEQQRRRTRRQVIYFVGLLVLFVALMSRDVVFVLFTITGFFHAFQLKPWPIGVAGIFGTSVVLNTMTMGVPGWDAQELGAYVGVIAIQTIFIGAGVVFSEKSEEQNRHRAEMVEKLQAALEENAGLHAQLLTQAREAGVLDERQRIAREIHDTLAQGLTGIITQMQAAQQIWHAPGQAREHLDQGLALARDSLAEARRSLQALRPRALDEAHLPEAIGDMAQRWADESGVNLHVDVTGDPVPLSPALEVALFRVAQEALANVAKHAHASRVGLTLSYLDDVVLLDIRDDGVGMNGQRGQGFGIDGMTQRIRGVGGSVEIESALREGTAVSTSVPAITVTES